MEHAFSQGSLTVSRFHHGLSDQSIRAGVVLSSWAKIPGLIPSDEIIKVFGDKQKRTSRNDINSSTDTIVIDNE